MRKFFDVVTNPIVWLGVFALSATSEIIYLFLRIVEIEHLPTKDNVVQREKILDISRRHSIEEETIAYMFLLSLVAFLATSVFRLIYRLFSRR